jgi:putative ABC transport system substrate-binding protein
LIYIKQHTLCPLWVKSGHRSATGPCPLYPQKLYDVLSAAQNVCCWHIADIAITVSNVRLSSSLIILPDTYTTVHRDSIIELADRHQLPSIYPFRYFATQGGLVSYGVDAEDLVRRAAGYIDRILKGEKPADLPVQAPVKYELVINLRTAKSLGLPVSPTLLARADEVIQ